jgi:hypothetical protein
MLDAGCWMLSSDISPVDDVCPTPLCCMINGLMLEILEGHIRHHVMNDGEAGSHSEDPIEAAEELIDVLRKYLR